MVSSSTIPEGTWHTRGHLAYQGAPGKPRKENTERGWSFLEFMKAAPLIVKLLLAIFGGGITITVVIVIPPPNMASKSFTIKGAAFINSRNDQPRSVFSLRGFPGAPWYARCPLV